MCAFTMPSKEQRNKFIQELLKNKVIMLGCGEQSVRFRTPLTVAKDELDRGLSIIKKVLKELK